ncbi:hypothetical protein [Photobacterium angustum]|uniref:Uncharacterized protein n=1 Tax=Photobacterium angustum TaxID=661 RepID=A0A855S8R2_PHOAN|nr:hypothetical protein [Photobacterium angustum]KJG16867.1 hypothetical protein UA33_12675 [Photobacterium angustum]KJG23114.1 hypothetical protein UA39_11905 [Photobacterium angustum]KJG30146.1 hypothetical protein UA36_12925 [Photobacterium angustum]KJG35376.1 hypothetical protein UA35_21225 [Photobacterium angustum]KJG48715.1 hypothetical protein UA30_11365 [Photobacterium angustum]
MNNRELLILKAELEQCLKKTREAILLRDVDKLSIILYELEVAQKKFEISYAKIYSNRFSKNDALCSLTPEGSYVSV